MRTIICVALALLSLLCLIGCGNNQSSATATPAASKTFVETPGATVEQTVAAPVTRISIVVTVAGVSKTASVAKSTTALAALKSVFTYSSSNGVTVINGQKGPWKYTVNGALPTVGPTSCVLTQNCTLAFSKL